MSWGRGRALKLLMLLGLLLCSLSPAVGEARPDRIIAGPPPGPPVYAPGMPPARMGGDVAVNQPVEIRMMVVLANNDVEALDPKLLPFRRHLSVLNYKGFRLMFNNEMVLRPGMTRSLGLFDGKVIEVTLLNVTPRKAELRVKMYNPKLPSGVALDTTVSVTRKGTFFIGGPRFRDGVLLLPITTWY